MKSPSVRARTRRAASVRAALGVRSLLLSALLCPASQIAFAGAASIHPFSVELSTVNQCTGEAMTIALEGKVISQHSASGGMHHYSVQSNLRGSAIGDTSGTRYHFTGNERAEFESETPTAELSLFNNVRILTKGGQTPFIGFDEQTISIDETAEIRDVAHRFDFSCD